MASNEMNSISKRSTYQPEQTKENIVSQQIANNKIQNIIIINYELNSCLSGEYKILKLFPIIIDNK